MGILVVDDDAIVARSCSRIPESEGYEASAATGAEEALELLRKGTFALLIIDLMMPQHDGLFLLKEIRGNMPELPVIAMSGYATPEIAAAAFKSGADRFMPKPFRPDELLQSIHLVLQRNPEKQKRATAAH
jgi:DNA-binding response OmpR family regulator